MDDERKRFFRCTGTFRTLEELHCGTGLGRGAQCDDAQMRDRRGLPVVSATTVRGLVREQARRLGNGDLFNRFFNYASGDSLMFRSARLADEHAVDLFVLVSRTAIDPDTGAAMDQTLRTIECARRGLTFTVQVQGSAPEGEYETATAFVKRALSPMQEIGGGRRRGTGAIQWISEPVIEDLTHSEAPSPWDTDRIIVVVKLLEPTCLAQGFQAGSVIHSQDYIPGTTFLGALRHIYRTDPDVRDALGDTFLDDGGPMSVSNLYPLPDSMPCNPRVLPMPVPMSFRGEKRAKDPFKEDVLDRDGEGERPDARRLKRIGGFLFIPPDGDPLIYAPPMEIRLRNRIDSDTGRVAERDFFGQEALAEGVRLAGVLRFDSPGQAQTFLRAFGAYTGEKGRWIGLGRGRQPVSLAFYPMEASQGQVPAEVPDTFKVYLTSDAILRRPDRLTFFTKLNEISLAAGMGIEVPGDGAFEQVEAYDRETPVRGFSALGGLLRTEALALEKGSCAKFRVKDKVKAKAFFQSLCQHAVGEGIGERTGEGFGRLCVVSGPLIKKAVRPSVIMPVEGRAELWREEVHKDVEDFVWNNWSALQNGPSKSQWGLIVAAGSSVEVSLKTLKGRLCQAAEKRGGTKWKEARVLNNTLPLKDWIIQKANEYAQKAKDEGDPDETKRWRYFLTVIAAEARRVAKEE